MKKIFTLIAMAVLAVGVNAQKITFAAGVDPKAGFANGDFKITVFDTEGKMSCDANNCYFGTAEAQEKFTARLKTGGKSGAKNSMRINVPADGTLKFCARTGSSSATDRNIVLLQDDKEIFNQVMLDANAIKATIEGEDGEKSVYPIYEVAVKAGEIAVTYPVGSVNFYAFEFVAGGSEPVANTTTVGAEDNSTGWWKVFSDYYVLSANGSLHLEFTNYSSKGENWNNFIIVLANEKAQTNNADVAAADGIDYSATYAEYAVYRADNYGWGSCYDENKRESNWNWDAFKDIMDGAQVKLDIVRNGAEVNINADVLGSDGNAYFQKYTMDSKEAEADIVVFLGVEKSHIVIDNTKTTVNGVSTGISATKTQRQSGVRYNLAGQQVDQNYRGVVIENGRKFYQK